MSTANCRRSSNPAKRPASDPPITIARPAGGLRGGNDIQSAPLVYDCRQGIKIGPCPPFPTLPRKRGRVGRGQRRNSMALTMSDKEAARKDRSEWPAALLEEFAREAHSPNGCVGSELVSETDKVRVWTIRLKPGQRFGFHRHVLNYFWTAVTPCRGRQHLMDGTTGEFSYAPG